MTITDAISPALRGDICPEWCGELHADARTETGGRRAHTEDSGVHHFSPHIDTWLPLYGEDGGRFKTPVTVQVQGYRHDHADDWPDTIVADGVSPGDLGSVILQIPDARRLAEALLLACDLAEGIALPEVLR